MNRQILHWNRLRDGRFGVKVVRVSLMWVGCRNSFRMTVQKPPIEIGAQGPAAAGHLAATDLVSNEGLLRR